jgi:hypothetical protein
MFFQVLSTLFYMMGNYLEKWRNNYQYSAVEIISHDCQLCYPEEVSISLDKMNREFQEGFNHFKPMYQHVLEPETFDELSGVVSHLRKENEFTLNADLWSKVLYDFFYTFHLWQRNRRRLVDIITPLYFGRAGTFCSQVMHKSWEESEKLIQEQVDVFRRNREYLIGKFEGQSSKSSQPEF